MSRVARIADKIDNLRMLEQRYRFGAVIEVGTPLPELPGLPAAVSEVFSLFRRLEGSNFRFEPPAELASLDAWTDRAVDGDGPLGDWLTVGYDMHSVPVFALPDGLTGEEIRMDRDRGDVYFIESCEYLALVEDPDWGGAVIERIAPDVATFFDEFVLGDRYAELVSAVIGGGRRKQDTWMRLLSAAGLT